MKAFLLKKIREEGRVVENVNVIFCTDQYLLDINRDYLNHDNLTDIITFEISSPLSPIVSDIYISIDRVTENAATFKVSFDEELLRVLFHGVLHLCGYNDKSKVEIATMRNMEQSWLNKYFVSLESSV